MNCRRRCIPILIGLVLQFTISPAHAQVMPDRSVTPVLSVPPVGQSETSESLGSQNDEGKKFKGTTRRQALLRGGVAISAAAYGFFTLRFNNSRGDAANAEKAYEADVRQNAQDYLDQGIKLDQIQTYKDWQKSFEDAKSAREWGARAGFVAVVVGLFAVLDAATSTGNLTVGQHSLNVMPVVGVSQTKNDFLVGARVRF